MKEFPDGKLGVPEAIASSAVKAAIAINASFITVLTETGNTARLVAKYRPGCPVLVLTASTETAAAVSVYKNCTARVMGSMIGSDSLLRRAGVIGRELGWAKPGD